MPELNPKDEQNSIKSRGDKYFEQREQHVQSSIGIICMKESDWSRARGRVMFEMVLGGK